MNVSKIYNREKEPFLYSLEGVKVTAQEAEQCKTRLSSYTLKTGVQTRLTLLSVQSYRRACKWSCPGNEMLFHGTVFFTELSLSWVDHDGSGGEMVQWLNACCTT